MPRVRRFNDSSPVQFPRPTPETGVGKVAREAGAVFAGILGEQKRRADNIALIQAKTAFQKDLSSLTDEFGRDPDLGTASERFSIRSAELIKQHAGRLDDENIRASFEATATGFAITRSATVSNSINRRLTEQQRSKLGAFLDQSAIDIGNSENPEDAETIARSVEAELEDAQGVYINDAPQRKQKFLENADLVLAARMTAENPAAAFDMLSDTENFPNLDPLVRIRLRSSAKNDVDAARNRVDKAQERENAKQLGNLSIRIKEGAGTVDGFLEEIEQMWKDDAMTGTKRESLLEGVVALENERLEQSNQIAHVQSILDGGKIANPNNEDSRAAVNGYYDNVITAAVETLGDERGDVLKIQFTDETQVVAASFVDEVVGLLRGDDQEIIRGANQLDKIGALDNGKLMMDSFPEEEVEIGLMVARNVNYGTPPQQAVEDARKALQPDAPRLKRLREKWAAFNADGRVRQDFVNAVSERPGLWGLFSDSVAPGSLFGSDVEIPDVAIDEYEALRFDSFLRTGGDEEVSHRSALGKFARVWHVTNVTGPQRWQKHAPEVWYPEFGSLFGKSRSNALQEQLFNKLIDTGIITDGFFSRREKDGRRVLTPDGRVAAAKRFRLAGNSRTARRIDPRTGRNAPEYTVLEIGNDGEFRAVTGFNRFHFDYGVTPAGIKELEDIEEAKRDAAEFLQEEVLFREEMRGLVSRTAAGRLGVSDAAGL